MTALWRLFSSEQDFHFILRYFYHSESTDKMTTRQFARNRIFLSSKQNQYLPEKHTDAGERGVE